MLALALLAALAEVPPVQVAAPDLSVVNLDKDRGTLFTEHLAQQLTALGLTVVTSKQMSALLGQERQRQLMGCDVSTSCMAELASAMGSDAVLVGTVAKLDGTYQLNVSLVAAKDAKPVTVLSSRESSEVGVLDALTREAPRLAQEAVARLRPGHSLTLAKKGVRPLAWIPAVAGALLAASGGVMLTVAASDSDRLRGVGVHAGETLTLAEARALATDGQNAQSLGVALVGAGAVALLAAGGMALFGADTPAAITLAPAPGGFGVALGGTF